MSNGLLQVWPDFRSPTRLQGSNRTPIRLRLTTDGVHWTSNTMLRLILTILGLKAFIWSPRRTSTSPIWLWWTRSVSGETQDCRLNNLKSPTRLNPNFLVLWLDFVKINESNRWINKYGMSRKSLILTSEVHRTPIGLWTNPSDLSQFYQTFDKFF